MTIETLMVCLLIGAVAGWLTGLIVKDFGFRDVAFGIVGAVLAGWLLAQMGINIGRASASPRPTAQVTDDLRPLTTHFRRTALR
jgi:hypothetical protein